MQGGPFGSGLAQRLDQLPLAHAGASGNAALLRHLVQLLPRPILIAVPGLPAPPAGLRSLTAHVAARLGGQVCERALAPRRLLRLADVRLRGLHLLLRRHVPSPSVVRNVPVGITSANVLPAASPDTSQYEASVRGGSPRPVSSSPTPVGKASRFVRRRRDCRARRVLAGAGGERSLGPRVAVVVPPDGDAMRIPRLTGIASLLQPYETCQAALDPVVSAPI